ncbi:MAG TPA: ABC transporter permease [Anaerolineaceae bacterium]|nr:ABC transporter permease [Anaerolineaceae bacterium]
MRKFWLIFRNEYLRHVLRRRFIFALLSLPVFVALLVGVGLLAAWSDYDHRPVGYVDLSGFFLNARQVPSKTDNLFPPPIMQSFSSEAEARAELQEGQIQAYFTIDPQYLKNGTVRLYTLGSIKGNTRDDFQNFLRYNLLSNQPQAIAERVLNGPEIVVQSLSSNRKMASNEVLNILLPLISGLLFVVVINISGSYLVQALVEEKENRTMEIVVTSVSHAQLMAGKIVGNLLVGLTELIIWLSFGFLGLAFAQRYIPGAQNLNINFDFIWLMAVTLLPAFVMVAALMAAVGASTSGSREAQQWAGLFTLPIVIPFWLVVPLMESPNSPLAIGMSFFPLTAPVTLPLRAAFTDVPAWQTIISVLLLIACAAAALWLAGRTFRMGMLRYGKRLTWREIFGKAG